MFDIAAAMAMLQHGDSFFPSGATSFSWGLESLVEQGQITGVADARQFILGQIHGRWASFDLPIILAAHRAAEDVPSVILIDDQVEMQTCIAEFRSASRRLGDAMLSVFGRLGLEAALSYRSQVRFGAAHGHLSVVQGFLWAKAGHDEATVIALSGHTFCIALLGACLRLGCLGHFDAQRILSNMRAEICKIAGRPIRPISRLSSCTIEAEIAVIRNSGLTARLFAT